MVFCVASLVSEQIAHDLPHGGDIIQTLQAQPKRLCAWFTVALATEEATESDDMVNGLTQARRFFRGGAGSSS